MSVKIVDNSQRVKSERDNRLSLAVRFMLDGVHQEATPHTPKRYGNLRADVVKSVSGKRGIIRWTKNYAIYQERKQFSNYTTAGTGPHFARNAVHTVVKDPRPYLRKAGL